MGRRSDPSEDNWHNVEDAKKRKQIQDRLAQRARRKRLRQAKNNAKPTTIEPETRRPVDAHDGESQVSVSDSGPLSVVSHDTIALSTSNSNTTESSGALLVSSYPETLPHCLDSFVSACSTLSPTAQPHFPMTVFSALYINGQILGLACSTNIPHVSAPAGPNVPIPLRPTQLQLTTFHQQWIDRVPFPKSRDCMIMFNDLVDDEEFVRDVFLMPSFQILPGRMPWDPRAWKIERPFAEKWGYLFV